MMRQEIIDRYRAVRGVSLLRHPYMVGGCVYYKYSLRLTLTKLLFVVRTMARGV